MLYEFKVIRQVEFSETDMAGLMHFSNFFRFMESTEHAFFRSLGLALHQHEGERMSGCQVGPGLRRDDNCGASGSEPQ